MMKIHIMNLLHDVPKGDLPPPQSEASIRCCSAKLPSIYDSNKLLCQDQQHKQINPKRVHKVPIRCTQLQRLVRARENLVSERLRKNVSHCAHSAQQMNAV